MKKFYRFFSLLLLSIVGVATAAAQYNQGTMLTSMDEIVGKQVALFSNGTSFGTGYLCGTEKSATITEDCLYEFVATDNTSSDGYATYYLKQVSTGKYLKDFDEASVDDPEPSLDASYAGYTSSVDQAMEFVVAPADDDESAAWGTGSQKADYSMIGRGSYSLDCQNYDEGAFCISRAAKYNAPAMGNDYNGTCMFIVGYMAYAPYPDTNLWCIYSVTEQSSLEKLDAYIASEFPNELTYYEAGTNPGQVPTDVYNTLASAYQAAVALVNNGGSAAAADAALTALQEAKAAADAAVITLEDGKYYFIDNKRSSNAYVYANSTGLHATNGYSVPADAASASASDAAYLWKAVAVGDGTWYLQNLYTGTYAGETSETSGQIPCTEQPTVPLTFTYNTSNDAAQAGLFNITTPNCMYHIDGSYNMVKWSAAGGTGCLFALTEATEIANAVADAAAQEQVNKKLESLLAEAAGLYNRGRVFTSEAATADGLFDDPGLVTDESQLSANSIETSEGGGLKALLDNDGTTYFHSYWSTGTDPGDAYSYIQADLGEAVQNLVIKYSKRHNNQNGSPTQIRVYGSNDASTWTYAGDYNLEYPYSMTISDEEKLNFAGYRGIDLPAAYQYVRIEVIYTTVGKSGHPNFALSELRFYGDATYDATASGTFESVDATIAATLKSAIEKADAEYVAGAATEATIAELQAAYDAFKAQYPDVAILKEAIADAQTVVTSYANAVGTELGYFDETVYAALQTTIEEVQATIPTDGSAMTLAQIQEGVQKVEAAVEAFKNSVIMPEAGKYYKLLGMTTDDANTRALNAAIYAVNNSTTTSLKSAVQASENEIEVASKLNYLWKVVSIADGKMVLQNVGTGFYMNEQPSNNAIITLSATPVELGIQGISTGGGFNIIVGEGEYANFQGQGENIVSWSSASGTDNSSIKWIEVSEEDFVSSTAWNVTANVNQIVTLPIAIYAPTDQGDVYTVLGQKETDGAYTLELKALTSNDVLEAGMPFVFKPSTADATEIALITEAATLAEITYATEGKTTENGALTGVITADTIMTNATVLLKNGVARILGGATEAANRVADANTGYISYVVTEETGDAQIQLSTSMTTGIANAEVINTATPVDVYTISGVRVRANVKAGAASNGLPAGVYVIGGKKVLVK